MPKKINTTMTPAISPCPGCKPHAYQDGTYGRGVRLKNQLAKGKGYRCTVCEKVSDA